LFEVVIETRQDGSMHPDALAMDPIDPNGLLLLSLTLKEVIEAFDVGIVNGGLDHLAIPLVRARCSFAWIASIGNRNSIENPSAVPTTLVGSNGELAMPIEPSGWVSTGENRVRRVSR